MSERTNHPLLGLGEEDLNMVAAFVLVSGSIKDLAREYGVSYPTMRSRLNALIERMRRRMESGEADPLSDYLAQQIARGHMTKEMARRIRELHQASIDERRELNEHNEGDSHV